MYSCVKQSETPRNVEVDQNRHFEKQLLKVSEQIETLAERIATLPKSVDETVFYQQMIKLQSAKAELEVKAKENPKNFDFDSPALAKDLATFQVVLAEFLGAAEKDLKLKEQIMKLVVHKVEILKDGITIHFYIGESHYKEVVARFDGFDGSEEYKNKRLGNQPLKKFVDLSSTLLTIGGPSQNRTGMELPPHDFESCASTSSAKRPHREPI